MTQPTHLPSQPGSSDAHELKVGDLLSIVANGKWTIGAIAGLALTLGSAYAFLSEPVYEANLLIQVEDSSGAASSILGEASNLFNVKTPAAGEIEIIRSRRVIGEAVENTKLYIDARPKYLPFIGTWLAKRAEVLSDPGFLGLEGYVMGTERIVVPALELPRSFKDEPLKLVVREFGEYEVMHSSLARTLSGRVGTLLTHQVESGALELMVAEIDGKPGAEFEISRTSRLSAVESLQKRLQLFEKGRQSGVINATLQDTDPKRLTVVLNEIGRQYVRQNVERKSAEAEKTLAFLGEQLPQYKRQQEEAEELYNQYRNSKGTVAFDEEAKLVLGQAVDLQTKLIDARQRRKELEARFTNSHPNIQTLDSQIHAFSREIEKLNVRVKSMPQIQQDAMRMERDVRVNSEMYQSLLNSSLQLSLIKEGKVGNVRLLDEAAIPEVAVKPRRSLIVGAAVVLGVLLGIVIAVLRSSLRRGIQSSDEIEAETGLSVYSTIPLSASQNLLEKHASQKREGIHLLAMTNPTEPAIESLRSLRTALQFATLEASNNVVLISGATPGVGKSFVSANFAAILAVGGKRVLLIDADLRKGHINQQLGLRRERGLSELISGSELASAVIHKDIVPGLDVITTGVLPPNPAELMLSESFGKVLSSLSINYDVVIVDSPPVLVAADTCAIAPHVGTLLLVARADHTHMPELQESVKRLAHAGTSVNGVLLNAMDVTSSRYGGKYGGYRYVDYSYQADGR